MKTPDFTPKELTRRIKAQLGIGKAETPKQIDQIKRKGQASIRAGDWFGCGHVITTESWEGFLKARAEYYAKVDALIAAGVPNDKALGQPRP